jgi:hypothetical protein
MKKTILSIGLVMVALVVVGVGAVFAQGPTQSTGNGPMLQNGAGPLHTYMVAAFAEKLSLQAEDVNAQLAAGESMYDIAITAGVQAENFPALMVEVRSDVLSAAVKAGTITQEQADWISARGFGRGYGTGNCPIHSGQSQQPNCGAGMWNGNGRGMMGGGFGWQNQQTNP